MGQTREITGTNRSQGKPRVVVGLYKASAIGSGGSSSPKDMIDLNFTVFIALITHFPKRTPLAAFGFIIAHLIDEYPMMYKPSLYLNLSDKKHFIAACYHGRRFKCINRFCKV